MTAEQRQARIAKLEVRMNEVMARAATAKTQLFRDAIRIATDLQRQIRNLRLGA